MAVHKRSSLKDIAEALGLSKTTVSFVLNGKANEYHIGEETAKRVWEMAERLKDIGHRGFRHFQPILRFACPTLRRRSR